MSDREVWMVVDRQRAPVHVGIVDRAIADAEAAELNERGERKSRPFRVVPDVVAADLEP